MSHVVTRDLEPAHAINAYSCTDAACGWRAVTISRTAGLTPRFIPCERHPQHRAESACYIVAAGSEPTHEWVKPTDEEIRRKPWLAGYVARGGLLLRPLGVLVCR